MMSSQTICFVGGGNMARSLIGGLIDDGMKPQCITVGEPDAGRREQLANDFGVTGLAENAAAINTSDIVIFAVKPQVMKTAVLPLVGRLSKKNPLLISIAAGIPISSLESWVGNDLAMVRAMPNTPALINAGITALFANSQVLPVQRDHAESILTSVGKVVWVEDETLIDTVTAVSGSGPAYFFYFMEALEQAAIEEGLDQETARLLILETALGATRLAIETKKSLLELRGQVTSPGGTTESAIQVLEHANTRQILKRAVTAARKRSADLANSSDTD
jgi:pyrroline-5-carboxylate reductase